jgi:hypothetical protein
VVHCVVVGLYGVYGVSMDSWRSVFRGRLWYAELFERLVGPLCEFVHVACFIVSPDRSALLQTDCGMLLMLQRAGRGVNTTTGLLHALASSPSPPVSSRTSTAIPLPPPLPHSSSPSGSWAKQLVLSSSLLCLKFSAATP